MNSSTPWKWDNKSFGNQVIRYGVLGLLTNATFYIIYLKLTALGMKPKLCMSVLYCLGFVVNFWGNRNWTFPWSGSITNQFKRVVLTYFIAYLINLTVLHIFAETYGCKHQWVMLFLTIIMPIYFFFANKYYVFRQWGKNVWVKKIIFSYFSYLSNLLFFILNLSPPLVRHLFFKLAFKKVGKNNLIDYGTYFRYFSKIEIGNNVAINRGVEIFTSLAIPAKVIIHDNVVISPNVKIYGAGHSHASLGLPDTAADIVIERSVWICANVVILQGCTIGEGAVISANSLVNKNVEPFSIYAGVPAKKIKDRVIADSVD